MKLWGGVPLVTAPVKSADPAAVNIPRSTDVEVYAQILADLDSAASLLPDVYGTDASINKARATSGAAKACLQKPSPDYQRALDYIEEVENSEANYVLIDYAQLFDGNGNNSGLRHGWKQCGL